jgi:cellobiose-specific phosphotransferase system component IIC
MIYMSLRWEGAFWLLVVAAGYVGVKLAARLCGDTGKAEETEIKKQATGEIALPLVVTSAIAWPLVNILAQSPKIPVIKVGTIYSQPYQAQIAFALLAGFGIAGYLVRRYMKVRLEIPIISTVLFSLGAAIYCGRDSIQSLALNMPPSFFKFPICSILPIQIIAFGSLGVLVGYAIAVLGHHKKRLLEEEQAVNQ